MGQKVLAVLFTILSFSTAYATVVPDWKGIVPSLKQTEMKQLSGGFTNKVFLFTQQGKQYVIKYHNKKSDSFGISRRKELKFQTMAAKRDLAPRLLYQDINLGVTVTEYVPGTVFTYRSFNDPKLFVKALKLMKALHQTKRKTHKPHKCGAVIFDILTSRLEVIRKSNPSDLPLLEAAYAYVKENYETHPEFSELVTIHGDFFSYNIVDDGKKLKLIDWELSDWGTPYLDIASLMVIDDLDFEKIELALNTYFDTPTEVDRKCLQGTALIYRLSSVFYFKLLMKSRHDARKVKYTNFYDLHMKRFWEQLKGVKKDATFPKNLKTVMLPYDTLSG